MSAKAKPKRAAKRTYVRADGQEYRTITVYLPTETHSKLSKGAAVDHRSVSWFAGQLLEEAVR